MTVIPPVCEFPWLLAPLYKQVEVRQGWQEQQAGTDWSTAVSAEGMTGCSSKSMVLLSLLGLLALLLCGSSEGEWPRLFPLWRAPGAAHSWQQDEPGLEGNGFSKICCHIPSSVTRELDGCLELNTECPRQQGSMGQMGFIYFVFIYFVVVLHSSTKQPGLLPVLHQSASAAVGPEGLHWTALQWGLRHPCHHVSYSLNFCWFFWHVWTLDVCLG